MAALCDVFKHPTREPGPYGPNPSSTISTSPWRIDLPPPDQVPVWYLHPACEALSKHSASGGCCSPVSDCLWHRFQVHWEV